MIAQLRYGYSEGIPEGHKTAWGCRLVARQDGYVDFVHDRTDVIGPDESRRNLLDYLNEHVPMEAMTAKIANLLAMGEMDTRDAAEFVLFDDGMVQVKANTQASAGYCYVVAHWVQEF